MDNSQQKHDMWMSRYRERKEPNFDEYTKIINLNNSLLENINKGVACVSKRSYDEAIKVLCLAVNSGEQLLSDDNLIDEEELAKAYLNRGVAYENISNHKNALNDKTKSVEMLEKLRGKRHIVNDGIVATAYLNRAVTYVSMSEYDMAIADGEKSVDIWNQLKREGKSISNDDYTNSLSLIQIAKNAKMQIANL